VPSVKRKDTEKVIVQSSISPRKSHDQRPMSWGQMVMVLIFLLFIICYTIRFSFRCVWVRIRYGLYLPHLSQKRVVC